MSLTTQVLHRVALCLAVLAGGVGAVAGEAGAAAAARGYELVSPTDKNGGDVSADTGRTRAAADGSAVQFTSLAGFAGVVGTGVAIDYISQRTGLAGTSGWSTHAITPEQESLTFGGAFNGLDPLYVDEFSDDLSRAVYRAWLPLTQDPNVAGVANLYLRENLRTPGAVTTQLVSSAVAPVPSATRRSEVVGASVDFRHVLFESELNLVPEASGAQIKLYEWAGGATRLAGVRPDGTVPGSSQAGLGTPRYTPRTISDDGSRIFFRANPTGELYVRIGGAASVQLNASEKSVADPPEAAALWTASVDGSRAFFTTTEQLLDGDTNSSVDLYMWEQQRSDEAQSVTVSANGGTFTLSLGGQTTAPIAFDATPSAVGSALADLSVVGAGNVSVEGGPGDTGGTRPYIVTFGGRLAGVNVAELIADGSGLSGGSATTVVTTTRPVANLTRLSVDNEGIDAPDVSSVAGTSIDGRYVYFIAAALIPGQPATNNGLYLWHDGDLRFIGGLDTIDVQLNGPNTSAVFVRSTSTARVTDDGRHVLFMSRSADGLRGQGGFPGYDHGNACTYDVGTGGPCRELYVYSADTDTLACASCSPSGATATADAQLQVRVGTGGANTSRHLSHALADDGSSVYFTIREALVLGDTNNKLDAYEYDMVSGRPRLISSGRSTSDSYFLDASADGDNVFFVTRERLVAWDVDDNYDLYDARVGGGFPEPVVPPAPCAGSACQHPPTVGPLPGRASSEVFNGRGDAGESFEQRRRSSRGRACRRGTVRRRVAGRVRCVRRNRNAVRRAASRATRGEKRRSNGDASVPVPGKGIGFVFAPLIVGRLRRKSRMPRRIVGVTMAIWFCWAASALAAGPAWRIDSMANTTAQQGGTIRYIVNAMNVGDTPTDGTGYTLVATLPTGLLGISGVGNGWSCPGAAGAGTITCTRSQVVSNPAGRTSLTLTTAVVPVAADILTTEFELSGGGASSIATTADPTTIAPTPPGFGIDAFDVRVSADSGGTPLTQAGGHAYGATTWIDFNTGFAPSGLTRDADLWPIAAPKTIVVDLPPGFVGNPTGVTRCTGPELATVAGPITATPLCSPTSQVGTTLVKTSGAVFGPIPVYNLVPPPDVPARFGFNALGTVVVLDAEVRSGDDYGLTIVGRNVSQGLALSGAEFSFWGVPSDASHDAERACPSVLAPWERGPMCRSGAPPRAFLRNPTSCTAPGVGLPTTLSIDSWANPGPIEQRAAVSHLPRGYPYLPADWGPEQGTNGCSRVPFDPVLRMQPTEGSAAGAPAAFTVDVELPQTDDPSAIAQSDLQKAVVTLPRGVRVSPSSADGLEACSSAQIALDSSARPTCPDASKVGSVVIDTPLLDEQVKGGIFLATPFDNPFDSLIAIYLVAEARGVVIKLPGQVRMDPATGQISSTFDDNPQLPFSRLHLEFNGGPRAPLVAPKRCGTYTTTAALTGWNGRTVVSESSFTLNENARGQPCPSTFAPGFSAGTESNAAGSSSSFHLRLTREDEDQELRGLTLDLPSGLTGAPSKVILCGEGDAAAGTCPEGSRVGSVTVGAGAGANPFFITNGRAYFTGPYHGAPFGLAIVVPAVAGPFNLGDVTVRSALFIDKHTADVRVVTDPFPTILQGIPLDVRDVRVNVDKEGFFVNPTSCAVKTIRGVVESTEGSTANVSTRFQAADCGSLEVRPRMTLEVGGNGNTNRGRTTPLKATLRQTPGQTNLRFVRVTLPTTINARLTVINEACTRAEFEAGNCDRARAGTAVAMTPLLRDPLRGNAYFVRNGNPLPDLIVALRGQVDFDLIGRITIPGSKRLRTTFELVPDVPISMFSLRLVAGRDASIGNAANLCSPRARRAKAELDFRGQNGKVLQVDQRLKVKGCRARAGRRARGRGARKRGR